MEIKAGDYCRYIGDNDEAPIELLGSFGTIKFIDTKHQCAGYQIDSADYQILVPLNELEKVSNGK